MRDCQPYPTKNVFSKDFYQAQRYVMDKYNLSKAGGSVTIPIEGIPVGIGADYENLSTVHYDESKMEKDAQTILSYQLETEKEQIIGEVTYAYCKFLEFTSGNNNPYDLATIESYERVLMAIVDPKRINSDIGYQGQLHITPRNVYYTFKDSDQVGADDEILIKIVNGNEGNINLRIDTSMILDKDKDSIAFPRLDGLNFSINAGDIYALEMKLTKKSMKEIKDIEILIRTDLAIARYPIKIRILPHELLNAKPH